MAILEEGEAVPLPEQPPRGPTSAEATQQFVVDRIIKTECRRERAAKGAVSKGRGLVGEERIEVMGDEVLTEYLRQRDERARRQASIRNYRCCNDFVWRFLSPAMSTDPWIDILVSALLQPLLLVADQMDEDMRKIYKSISGSSRIVKTAYIFFNMVVNREFRRCIDSGSFNGGFELPHHNRDGLIKFIDEDVTQWTKSAMDGTGDARKASWYFKHFSEERTYTQVEDVVRVLSTAYVVKVGYPKPLRPPYHGAQLPKTPASAAAAGPTRKHATPRMSAVRAAVRPEPSDADLAEAEELEKACLARELELKRKRGSPEDWGRAVANHTLQKHVRANAQRMQ